MPRGDFGLWNPPSLIPLIENRRPDSESAKTGAHTIISTTRNDRINSKMRQIATYQSRYLSFYPNLQDHQTHHACSHLTAVVPFGRPSDREVQRRLASVVEASNRVDSGNRGEVVLFECGLLIPVVAAVGVVAIEVGLDGSAIAFFPWRGQARAR